MVGDSLDQVMSAFNSFSGFHTSTAAFCRCHFYTFNSFSGFHVGSNYAVFPPDFRNLSIPSPDSTASNSSRLSSRASELSIPSPDSTARHARLQPRADERLSIPSPDSTWLDAAEIRTRSFRPLTFQFLLRIPLSRSTNPTRSFPSFQFLLRIPLKRYRGKKLTAIVVDFQFLLRIPLVL